MVLLQLSPAAKSRTALLALAALVIWPVLHFTMVQKYELNPWKFFGFAMYCSPTLPVRANIEVIEDGKSMSIDPNQLSRAGRGAMRRFVVSRGVLGTFEDPDPVAAWVFHLRPQAEEVRIEVLHAHIDRGTGRIVEDRYPYEYRRGDVSRS